ncbi:MAG: hypothetical protein EAZ95_12825, partial [Bacteroidetes bacterium]
IDIQDLGKNKDLREIAFTATSASDAGIEFYAWDFAFDGSKFSPTVYFDREGKQSYNFPAGVHQIAVKVVDNEGLESFEIVKIKVNGVVERK